MTLYRMAEPAHNMDDEFHSCLQAAGIRIVDTGGAPFNVIFEHEDEEVLRQFWRDNWGDEDGQPYIVPAAALPCATVRRLYEVRIDFQYPEPEACDSELVDNELFHIIFKFETEDSQIFGGNPTCGPYFTAWLSDEGAAHRLGRALVDRMVELGCEVTS